MPDNPLFQALRNSGNGSGGGSGTGRRRYHADPATEAAVDRIIAEMVSRMASEVPDVPASYIGHRFYAVYLPQHVPEPAPAASSALRLK